MTKTPDETPARRTLDDAALYTSRPTRTTLFLRTFIPWQLFRFVWINFKVMRIIRKSHPSVHEHTGSR